MNVENWRRRRLVVFEYIFYFAPLILGISSEYILHLPYACTLPVKTQI